MLATNPKAQEKLREEIFTILPEKNSKFNEDFWKNIPYLRACIKETLRIHPVVPTGARATGRDVVLNGYQVPKHVLSIYHYWLYICVNIFGFNFFFSDRYSNWNCSHYDK